MVRVSLRALPATLRTTRQVIMRTSALTKWVSFGAAILNCLVAGTLAVFALYAPQIQSHLHYTSLQVNTIGIACQLGLYLTVPILGVVCDSKGPRVVAAYAAFLSFPAYFVASLAYTYRWNPWILVTCYACLGSATVALYLSGLSTVAKNHPNSRGLSMALVTASFGLSGLWETQVVDIFYRSKATGEINIRAMYLSFGVLLSLAGTFSAFTLRIIHQNGHHSNNTGGPAQGDESESDEETALLSQSAILEPSDKLSQADRMKAFLRDHSSWWYFLAFILLAGPGEVFTNNLGTMFQSLYDDEVGSKAFTASSQVSLFALSSTIGRLVFGMLCDLPSKSPITARMMVLILTAILLTFGFLFLSMFATTVSFWVAAVSVGAGYGGLFTVYPAIISIVWGTENFATFWGCLATAPAVGSTAFGVLYAKLYDSESQKQGPGDLCSGRQCFTVSSRYFTAANLIGVVILLCATFIWRRRFATPG